MEAKKRGSLVVFVFAVLLVSSLIVSAEVDFRNIDLSRSYGPGQVLEGSFDLKLDEEPADSKIEIEISKGGEVVEKEMFLIDFLDFSEANYTCIPEDCSPNYTKERPESLFTVGRGENYIGLVIDTGNNTQITGLSFNMSGSGTSESCGVPPVVIDILDDKIIDWQYSATGDFCDSLKTSPTYDDSEATADYEIGEVPYCEKMTVQSGGKFKLGIDMINATPSSTVVMSLNDLESGELAECNLAPSDGVRTCDVEFNVLEEKDLYVCVQSSDEGNYKTKGERELPNCGLFGYEEFNCADSTVDYAIYLQPAAFKVFDEEVRFEDSTFNEFNAEDLVTYLQDYLDSEYGGNCDQECIIPIKITSTQESIEFSNLKFEYTNDAGKIETNKFYTLERDEAKMDMRYEKLKFSKAGFKAPSLYGEYDFELRVGGDLIKDVEIDVEKVPLVESLTPTTVFAAVETEFSVVVSSPKNNSIDLYEWDFGDGGYETSTIPSIKHSYPSGNYVISITVTDDEGLESTRSFDIKTLPPEEAVGEVIEAKKVNLNKIISAVKSTPAWYEDLVDINLDKIASDLDSFDEEYKLAGADYASLKFSLDQFPVYKGIKDEESGSSLLTPVIEVGYLRDLGEKVEVGKEEATKASIASWLAENLEIKAESTSRVAEADTVPEDDLTLVTIFDVAVESKNVPKNNIYLVIQNPEGFSFSDYRFKENVSVQDLGSAIGIVLDRVEVESFVFGLAGKVSVEELKVFASPTLQGLVQPDVYCGNRICEKSFGESYKSCPEDCDKPLTPVILLGVLIVGLVIGGVYFIWKYYVIMYEKSQIKKMFAQERDFYVLTFFIANETNKGKNEEQIRERLKKVDWNKEQIDFGFKKVKEQTRRMQKNSLMNYIADQMKAGKKIADIRLQLGRAGWETSLINWAVRKAKKKVKK